MGSLHATLTDHFEDAIGTDPLADQPAVVGLLLRRQEPAWHCRSRTPVVRPWTRSGERLPLAERRVTFPGLIEERGPLILGLLDRRMEEFPHAIPARWSPIIFSLFPTARLGLSLLRQPPVGKRPRSLMGDFAQGFGQLRSGDLRERLQVRTPASATIPVMVDRSTGRVTRLLNEMVPVEVQAAEELLPLVYSGLNRCGSPASRPGRFGGRAPGDLRNSTRPTCDQSATRRMPGGPIGNTSSPWPGRRCVASLIDRARKRRPDSPRRWPRSGDAG